MDLSLLFGEHIMLRYDVIAKTQFSSGRDTLEGHTWGMYDFVYPKMWHLVQQLGATEQV